ncbi:MAG: hypothetical protein DCF22_00435 [Leptolyngbya sp.]|nr:MAG: hypothetical protein DCF22_00435 [Leptolyngbya sp.]
MAEKKPKKLTQEDLLRQLSKLLTENAKPVFFRSGGRKVRLVLESKEVTFDLLPKPDRKKRDVS